MTTTAPPARQPARPAARRRPYAARVPVGQRREQLLDAALTIALAAGPEAVTMEAVARRAGVTKPVLYQLFAHRSALLAALVDREEARALDQLGSIVPAGLGELDAATLVAGSVRALVAAVQDRPEVWAILLRPAEAMPAEIRRRYERRRAELVATVGALVSAGRSAGYHDAADDELVAESLVALGELSGRLALAEPGRYGAQRLGAFVGGVAAALLPPPTRNAKEAPSD